MLQENSRRPTFSPPTIDDLIADPAAARTLSHESLSGLPPQVFSRIAALKTVDCMVLSLMLERCRADGSDKNPGSELLAALEVAQRWHIPESWVREQARLGVLLFVRLDHLVRF